MTGSESFSTHNYSFNPIATIVFFQGWFTIRIALKLWIEETLSILIVKNSWYDPLDRKHFHFPTPLSFPRKMSQLIRISHLVNKDVYPLTYKKSKTKETIYKKKEATFRMVLDFSTAKILSHGLLIKVRTLSLFARCGTSSSVYKQSGDLIVDLDLVLQNYKFFVSVWTKEPKTNATLSLQRFLFKTK